MADSFATSDRDTIVAAYLRARGIFSIEDAPDDMLDAAIAEADKSLGQGNEN